MSSKMKNLCSSFACVAVVILCCSSGCFSSSANIASVSGVITLDGEPLEGATVAFYPTSGRASQGVTDDTGRYELIFLKNEKGAVIGDHIVTVSTKVEDEVDYRGDVAGESGDEVQETVTKGRPETLPERYTDRRKSELKATVTSGSNVCDFPLEKK